MRGYKVRVNYKPVSTVEAKAPKDAITRVLAQGLRRVKGTHPNDPLPEG